MGKNKFTGNTTLTERNILQEMGYYKYEVIESILTTVTVPQTTYLNTLLT